MLTWYGAYVFFMKFNETIENAVKRFFSRGKVNTMDVSGQRDSIDSKSIQVPPYQVSKGNDQSGNRIDQAPKFIRNFIGVAYPN